jgi:hypothetical protein
VSLFSGKPPQDLVALVLAFGISVALNILTIAAILIAWFSDTPISENATQILASWGGGILGVLGAFVGYTFGKKNPDDPLEPPKPPKVI